MTLKNTKYYESNLKESIEDIFSFIQPGRILVVSGRGSFIKSGAREKCADLLSNYETKFFDKFSPNPTIEEVLTGVSLAKEFYPDVIVSIGGGTALDIAKAISILMFQDGDLVNVVKHSKMNNDQGITVIAVPTTSGSGSEATHFAVVYIDGKKFSIAHSYMKPSYVILDSSLTYTVPRHVYASSALDAFSQAVESYWSINSTKESKKYSSEAIKMILSNIKEATEGESVARKKMHKAANLAGRAINITKTTAAHAMSYPLTSHYGIQHGHAVALNLGEFFVFNDEVDDRNISDPRGCDFLKKTMRELYSLLSVKNAYEARDLVYNLITTVGLESDLKKLGVYTTNIESLIAECSAQRAKNNPRVFNTEDAVKILKKHF